jgi:hypothetical protein
MPAHLEGRSSHRTRGTLERLRLGRAGQYWRGSVRTPRRDPGEVPGDRNVPAALCLRRLPRGSGASAGAGPFDRGRASNRGATGPYRRRQYADGLPLYRQEATFGRAPKGALIFARLPLSRNRNRTRIWRVAGQRSMTSAQPIRSRVAMLHCDNCTVRCSTGAVSLLARRTMAAFS